MEKILEKILSKLPNVLSKFQLMETAVASPERWNSGPTFVTKQIACICGSELMSVATDQRAETTGIFRKKQVVTHLPPVYLSCPKCSRTELLFDPAIHGWNGQGGGDIQASDASRVVPFKESFGTVIVNYSYQGIENYEDLLSDGVQNPEDYFDTFTVYFREQGQSTFEQVVSSECA